MAECAFQLVYNLSALSKQVHGDHPRDDQDGSLRDRTIRARHAKGSPSLYSFQTFAVLFVPHTVCLDFSTVEHNVEQPPMLAITLLRDAVTSATLSAPLCICSQKVRLVSSITHRYLKAAFV